MSSSEGEDEMSVVGESAGSLAHDITASHMRLLRALEQSGDLGTDPRIHMAFSQVPRASFLPDGFPARTAGEISALRINGTDIHQSSPSVYTQVVRLLDLRPGHSFLHIGSGTGYLSAIVAVLVSPGGIVDGVELSRGNVASARQWFNTWAADGDRAQVDARFVHGDAFRLRVPVDNTGSRRTNGRSNNGNNGNNGNNRSTRDVAGQQLGGEDPEHASALNRLRRTLAFGDPRSASVRALRRRERRFGSSHAESRAGGSLGDRDGVIDGSVDNDSENLSADDPDGSSIGGRDDPALRHFMYDRIYISAAVSASQARYFSRLLREPSSRLVAPVHTGGGTQALTVVTRRGSMAGGPAGYVFAGLANPSNTLGDDLVVRAEPVPDMAIR